MAEMTDLKRIKSANYTNARTAHEDFFLNVALPEELTNFILVTKFESQVTTPDLENLNSRQRIKFIAGIIQKLGQIYLKENEGPEINYRYRKDMLSFS